MIVSPRTLGNSTLEIYPLVLGGNVFGWTADESTSHQVLDSFVARGGNMIDTADSYSFWHDGNRGGESETIIGRWLQERGNRDDVLIATKVSQHPEFTGLKPATITAGVEQSLRRLNTDRIDLYYAHFDDAETPLEESIEAFSELVDSGKVRYLGISNFSAARIAEWLRICEEGGYRSPVVVQKEYSLVERGIEADVLPLLAEHGVELLTYYSLARGFLAGKYRDGRTDTTSPRAGIAATYLDDRGRRILSTLDELAAAHGVDVGAVSLAWLLAQPGIAAPIASARNREQLSTLFAGAGLSLSSDEVAALTEASEAEPA
ncbi:aldo/keto reductase [Leucobacter celer]|uniref:aldo/keto reductase n=1 Tax=Leucobacter celer TaxID=668625 RepID=UPI0006A7A42D|nr:aldo/keto reductase [Leucobacter celer]